MTSMFDFDKKLILGGENGNIYFAKSSDRTQHIY